MPEDRSVDIDTELDYKFVDTKEISDNATLISVEL